MEKTVAIYPGRFQPFGPHHYEAYKLLANKFGVEDTYIATSDKTDPERSPFTFEEKKQIAMSYGIPGDKIVQVRSPYQPKEVLDLYQEDTPAIFLLGEKDATRLQTGKMKKDGTPGYFAEYNPNMGELEGWPNRGYVIIAPNISKNIPGVGEMSGTNIRQAIRSGIPMGDIFGDLDVRTLDMIQKKFQPQDLNEAIVGDKIECDKCDWSWDIKDGGDDLYVCHKCGYDNEPLNEAVGDKTLYAFDLDDTLITSKSNIIVTNPERGTFQLTPAEYALYTPGPDDELDFSEFASLNEPKVIPEMFNLFSQILTKTSKLPNAKTIILTARQPEVISDVKEFLSNKGLADLKVHAVGSSDPMEKVKVILDYIEDGYKKIRFYDDSPKNVRAVKTLNKTTDAEVKSQLISLHEMLFEFSGGAIMNKQETGRHKKKLAKLRKSMEKQGNYMVPYPDLPKTVIGGIKLFEGFTDEEQKHWAFHYDLFKKLNDAGKKYEELYVRLSNVFKNKPKRRKALEYFKNFIQSSEKIDEMFPPYKANMVQKTRYKASDVWTNDPNIKEEIQPVIGKDINPNLSQDKNSFKTFKKDIPLNYRIADSEEIIKTKEGPVKARKGDSIMTGTKGENWPIPSDKFKQTYDILGKGKAAKKKIEIYAKELLKPTKVKVSWSDDLLNGNSGDYLVQYGEGDYGIVEKEIFKDTYNKSTSNDPNITESVSNFRELYSASPPELQQIVMDQKKAQQNPEWHPEGNVLKHIITVTNRAIKNYPDNMDIILAAYFHDLGKLATSGVNPKTGHPTAYGHEKVSAELVRKYSEFISKMGANPENVEYLVASHMKIKPRTWDVMKQSKKDKMQQHSSFDDLGSFTKIDRGGLDLEETKLFSKDWWADILQENIIEEGGNIFKDKLNGSLTTRINKADVDPTLKWLETIVGLDLTNNKLGSTGIKDTSGDLDIAINQEETTKDELVNKLSKWVEQNHPEDDIKQWVRKSGISVHFKTPIKGNEGNGYVQTDLMFGNPEWMKFSLRGTGDNTIFKGVHRLILMASIAKSKGLKYSTSQGLTKRDTGKFLTKDPDKIAKILLGTNAGVDDLNSVETIFDKIKFESNYNELVSDAIDNFHFKSIKPEDNILLKSIEEVNLLQEGARIDHAEDIVFWEGSKGALRAVDALRNLEKGGHKEVTIKWDGSPAIIFGRDENGDFILTDKNGYVAKGYDGKTKSADDLEKMLLSRGKEVTDSRRQFAGSMKSIFDEYERAVPKEYRGLFKGDLLYYNTPPVKDKNFIFKPNIVQYAVDVDSDLGNKIGKSKTGVVIHRQVDAEGNESSLRDPDIFLGDEVLVVPPITAEKAPDVPNEELNRLEDIVKKDANDIDTLLNQDTLRKLQISDFSKILYAYTNSKVDTGLDNLGKDFEKWLAGSKVSQRKQGKITEYIAQNPKAFESLWEVVGGIMQAKDHIIDQLDKQGSNVKQSIGGQEGGEGYVLAHPGGDIKLVPRATFSKANRAVQRT